MVVISPLLTQRAFLRLEFKVCASIFIYQNEQENNVVDCGLMNVFDTSQQAPTIAS